MHADSPLFFVVFSVVFSLEDTVRPNRFRIQHGQSPNYLKRKGTLIAALAKEKRPAAHDTPAGMLA